LATVNVRFDRVIQEIDRHGIDNEKLQSVVLNPFTLETVSASLIPVHGPLQAGPTEIITLQPVEDVFLELGKGSQQSRDPSSVEKWDAASILEAEKARSSSPQTTTSVVKVVAQERDKVWLQFIVDCRIDAKSERCEPIKTSFVATPLSLQIEVGSGSWETSLIQPRQTQTVVGNEKDFVTFTILLLWKRLP